MAVHDVRGDAEQPRAHLDVLGAIGRTTPEGDQERLAEQVVGQLSDAAAQVPVHGRGVPVEEGGEDLGLGDRPRDQLTVRRRSVRQRAQPGWFGWRVHRHPDWRTAHDT
ncbi:hypothetical protein MVA48_16160 [Blastococcus sp. PRF04-17]|nr:hypothetical protein [Blastococcus sp. PRF04-17]UOY00523.1 hypothetical protein MVA48_16160 [Blastococcus sp. PRF04-17]